MTPSRRQADGTERDEDQVEDAPVSAPASSHRSRPRASPSNEEEDAEEDSGLRVGAICTCSDKLEGMRMTVVKFGTADDYFNNNRVYVRYQALKRGCVHFD